MNFHLRKLLNFLHLSYYDRTIFTKFYWRTLHDRHTKGFDETDTWSLDYTLSKLIAPRIKMFIQYADSSIPTVFLTNEYQKSCNRGYKWDSHRQCLVNKDERQRCWKRAAKQWLIILNKIKDGFEDDVLEGQNWEEWRKKWKPVVDTINKKLDKAKTDEDRKQIWEQIKSGREYRKDIRCITEDIVYNMRKEARYLLAKHYNDLWW